MSFLKKHKLLFLALLLALTLRTIFLDRFPTGITNDELHFVLNSKSVFYRFTNMAGNWFPLSLSPIPSEISSELTFLLTAPVIGPFPTNLFFARLPFVLFSLGSIILLYFIVLKLSTPLLASTTAFVTALNPYSIFVARTSFDAPVASFFFLLALFLILYLKKNLFLIIVPLMLAFYTYIGTKVIWLPFVYLISYISYLQFKPRLRQLVYLVLTSTVFFLIWSVNTLSSSTRTSELWSPLSPIITTQVQLEHDQSLQNPLKPLLTNNLTVFVREFSAKYLNNFSPDILFITGDHTFLVSLWKHGYFYLIDFILILFGTIFLYQHHRNLFYLSLGAITLSPIPEAIRHDSIPAYAFHSVLQYPYFYVIIGAGILFATSSFRKKFLSILFTLIYLLSFANFADFYFFKYPVYQPEGFAMSRRLVARYLALESATGRKITVLTREPDSLFRNYLFYNQLYTQLSFNTVKSIYAQSRSHIVFNKITFSSDDRNYQPSTTETLVVDRTLTEHNFYPSKFSINHLGDAHELYSIFNGQTCQGLTLDPFSHNLNYLDLSIEKLPASQFCRKFISLTFN
jgi:hypothetical protein